MRFLAKYRSVALGCLILVGLFLGAFLWITALVKTKVQEKLAAKFDVASFSCFNLSLGHLHICDLNLQRQDMKVQVPQMDISFHTLWIPLPTVFVDEVTLAGGVATIDLNKTNFPQESKGSQDINDASSLRINTRYTVVNVQDFDLLVFHKRVQATTHMSLFATQEQARITFTNIAIDGGSIKISGEKASSVLRPKSPFPTEISLTGFSLSQESLSLDSLEGNILIRDRNSMEVALKHSYGALHAKINTTSPEVTLTLDKYPLTQVPSLPSFIERGEISGKIQASKITKEGASIDLDLHADSLTLYQPKLARTPVVTTPSLKLQGSVDIPAKRLVIQEGSFKINNQATWATYFKGVVRPSNYRGSFWFNDVPCQDVLQTMPLDVLPALRNFTLEGNTSLDFEIQVSSTENIIRGGLDIDRCSLKEVPSTVKALAGPFAHIVRMKTGRTITRLMAPGDLLFTPYHQIPSSMIAAVLSTEDGAFFKHDGILRGEIQKAFRQNMEARSFRRGASTITMQMVKNVLLTHERTIARKLQELFLTWVVEKLLTKQRILEIYLNAVEFGPGIYGLADATNHYFDKTPQEISSLEAAFLASLLPRPVSRHSMWCRGKLTSKHEKYIRLVHRRMLAKKLITEQEFANVPSLVFSRKGWPGEKACLDHTSKIQQGKYTQGALSGLIFGAP